MTAAQRWRGSISAEALMNELRSDPEFVAREQARATTQAENVARYRRNAAPVIAALHEAGYPVDTVGDLRHSGYRYPAAIPVLLDWLPRVEDRDVKEDIVRTLSVPWARPKASHSIVEAFESLPSDADPSGTGLRWAIGNALEVLAHPSILEDMLRIVRDRRFGPARQMVVLGMARLPADRVVPTLLDLLADDEVSGHAAMALGRLREPRARALLERLRDEATAPWVRKEAAKALKKLGPEPDR